MKRIILLLFFVAFCNQSHAQYLTVPIAPEQIAALKKTRNGADMYAAKTTAVDSRWYNYSEYMDMYYTAISSSVAYSAPYLWKDTLATVPDESFSSAGWGHNKLSSVGLVSDLTFRGFSNMDFYPWVIEINAVDTFVIDSLRFVGLYGYNPARAYVDTLRVTFSYAPASADTQAIFRVPSTDPTLLSRYGLAIGDTMNGYGLHYDVANNTAMGTTVITKDIILDNTGPSPAWNDTVAGLYIAAVRLSPTGVTVPAGSMVGASISFHSGDPGFVPHDTLQTSLTTYKYSVFRPICVYAGTTSVPQWPLYDTLDKNNGVFKVLPDGSDGWAGKYTPMRFLPPVSGGPNKLQYPCIDFHVASCASCGYNVHMVNNTEEQMFLVPAPYPNPANDKLYVPFSLATAGNVTITLTNMLGQVLATQTITNATNGKATFQTASLADGVYTYTIGTGGQRTTGRVTIVH